MAKPKKTSSPAATGRGSMDSPPVTAGNDGKGAAMTKVPAPTPAQAPVAAAAEPSSSTMVEIPMSKLLIGAGVAALVATCSFFGYRSWKKHHTPKPAQIRIRSEPTASKVPSPHRGRGRAKLWVRGGLPCVVQNLKNLALNEPSFFFNDVNCIYLLGKLKNDFGIYGVSKT